MNAFLEGKKLRPIPSCYDFEPSIIVGYENRTVTLRREDKELFRAYQPLWRRHVRPDCPLDAAVGASCDTELGLIVADVGFINGACKHPKPTLEVLEVPPLRKEPFVIE